MLVGWFCVVFFIPFIYSPLNEFLSFNSVSDFRAFRKASLGCVCRQMSWLTSTALTYTVRGAVCRGSLREVRSATIGSMRMGGSRKADPRIQKKERSEGGREGGRGKERE